MIQRGFEFQGLKKLKEVDIKKLSYYIAILNQVKGFRTAEEKQANFDVLFRKIQVFDVKAYTFSESVSSSSSKQKVELKYE